MNIKCLMTTSVIALVSASAVQAADIMVSKEEPAAVVTFSPAFSWTGFYLGGQIGNLSSDLKIKSLKGNKDLSDARTPEFSGFMAGIYAGSNVDLGNGFVLGVETDLVWANREDAKQISAGVALDDTAAILVEDFGKATDVSGKDDISTVVVSGSHRDDDFTFKEKWSGATRVRLGFAVADRVMPYVAGGIAYAEVQGTDKVTVIAADKGKKVSGTVYDQTKTMVGYTLGAGVDFAMVDNVILRAEYRYSDFGKMKFASDVYEANYRTNDFRVGIAYKF
ncbi:outer membrane protein [Bartonella sp. B17]